MSYLNDYPWFNVEHLNQQWGDEDRIPALKDHFDDLQAYKQELVDRLAYVNGELYTLENLLDKH